MICKLFAAILLGTLLATQVDPVVYADQDAAGLETQDSNSVPRGECEDGEEC